MLLCHFLHDFHVDSTRIIWNQKTAKYKRKCKAVAHTGVGISDLLWDLHLGNKSWHSSFLDFKPDSNTSVDELGIFIFIHLLTHLVIHLLRIDGEHILPQIS